jgi:hypothetical protein
MNERTLNRPLDGEEVIEVVLNDIRRAMNRDCTLQKHLSYPAVSYKAVIVLQYQTTGKMQGTQVTAEKSVAGKFDKELPVEEKGTEVNGEAKPANQARLEAHLPIPAVTVDPTGKQVETRISYRDASFTRK